MELFVLIVKDLNVLSVIMKKMVKIGITGATVLEGEGMAQSIISMEDVPVFSMLKKMLVEEENTSQVMLVVLKKERLEEVKNIVRMVVGDLTKPNKGIMFSLPLTFVEGLK